MNWSVPAAIKWIKALERYDIQYVEQPGPDFDLEGMATIRRAVATPIAADESLHEPPLRPRADQGRRLRRLRRLPVRGRRTDARAADRRARAGGRQVVRDRQLGRARRRDDGQRARRGGLAGLRLRERHALSVAAQRRPSRFSGDRGRTDRGFPEPGLGVALDATSMATLAALELRESPSTTTSKDDAPSVGQIL